MTRYFYVTVKQTQKVGGCQRSWMVWGLTGMDVVSTHDSEMPSMHPAGLQRYVYNSTL